MADLGKAGAFARMRELRGPNFVPLHQRLGGFVQSVVRPDPRGFNSNPMSSGSLLGGTPGGGMVIPGTGDSLVAACVARGIPASICNAVRGRIDNWLAPRTPTTSTPSTPGTTNLVERDCPEGYRADPDTGECILVGLLGTVQRILPGGQTGTLEDVQGATVLGAMGIPAVVPNQVGTRTNGACGVMGLEYSPILQCPTGMVLGKDNLCYVKSSIPRGWRKWKPAPRPPITAGDAKAIRRAASATDRVARLAKNVGLRPMTRKKAR